MRLVLAMAVTFAVAASPAAGCMWDSDTLEDEVNARPGMAKAILEEGPPALGASRVAELRARIAGLRAAPNESDPKWWNELAAAHTRLGDAAEGARLLEGVVKKFPKDYGIHANLGTAYHLMGRYRDAWHQIGDGLRIDPEAHFGLERFHLALLDYLSREASYQARHVYIDDYSLAFAFPSMFPYFAEPELSIVRRHAQDLRDPDPRKQSAARASWIRTTQILSEQSPWDEEEPLREHPKFEEGVLYMASLNRNEPGAIVMLGVASLRNHDLNLAAKAFRRAIALGSLQRTQLAAWVQVLEEHVRVAAPPRKTP